MSITKTKAFGNPNSDRYRELLMEFPPRSITSKDTLEATQAVIDRLLDSPTLTPEETDYLNLLGMLVHEYEERHVLIPDLHGVELLKALIEELDLKQKDLVPIFKTESIVSAVLSGQRRFTVEHIEKLAVFFHVSPALFLTSETLTLHTPTVGRAIESAKINTR
jgi:HTH-type transcriptional regulator / antitoxin HigA